MTIQLHSKMVIVDFSPVCLCGYTVIRDIGKICLYNLVKLFYIYTTENFKGLDPFFKYMIESSKM